MQEEKFYKISEAQLNRLIQGLALLPFKDVQWAMQLINSSFTEIKEEKVKISSTKAEK